MDLRILLAVVGVGLVACGPRPMTEDGAPELETWSLVDPVVVSGGEAIPLTRVVDGVILPDGGVVVADEASSSVHVYSPSGAHQRSFGSEGDGPTEFRTIEAVGLAGGDTIWVHDFSHQRISFFRVSGDLIRVVSHSPRVGPGLVAGRFSDGSFVVGQAWSSAGVASAGESGLNREDVAYVVYSPVGALLDTIALVPGREVLLTMEDGRGVMGAAPFGRSAVHAVVDGQVVLGDQSEPELLVFDGDGSLAQVVRWDGDDLGMTAQWAEAWRESRLADLRDSGRERAARELDDALLPKERPAFGRLLAGGDREVWVAEYSLPGSPPTRWTVISLDDGAVAEIVVPDGFRPLHVSGDRVLGVTTDQFGVPTVELRKLAKP